MAGEEAVEEAAAAGFQERGAPQPAHVAHDILLEAAHVLLEGGAVRRRSCEIVRDRARSWEIVRWYARSWEIVGDRGRSWRSREMWRGRLLEKLGGGALLISLDLHVRVDDDGDHLRWRSGEIGRGGGGGAAEVAATMLSSTK